MDKYTCKYAHLQVVVSARPSCRNAVLSRNVLRERQLRIHLVLRWFKKRRQKLWHAGAFHEIATIVSPSAEACPMLLCTIIGDVLA
jgi:hypothetical protein